MLTKSVKPECSVSRASVPKQTADAVMNVPMEKFVSTTNATHVPKTHSVQPVRSASKESVRRGVVITKVVNPVRYATLPQSLARVV